MGEYTPLNHPAHVVYRAQLVAMAESLRAAQQPDGMWRASLLDPAEIPNPETSSTSGILYGLAYGVNAGILSRAVYLPVLRSAWAGLLEISVGVDGVLGYCQPCGAGPAPASFNDTGNSRQCSSHPEDFCVGLFLLAGAELTKT